MAKKKNYEKYFKKLFEECQNHYQYHRELVIIDFTEWLAGYMQDNNLTCRDMDRKLKKRNGYTRRVLRGSAGCTLRSMIDIVIKLGFEISIKIKPRR